MKCPVFEPMPKRFLVWDKGLKKFYEDSNGNVSSGGSGWLAEFLNTCGRPQELLEIVQSTNLFGKDNKEIFEGSIVENEDGDRGLIVYRRGAFGIQWVDPAYEPYALDEVVTTAYEVIGHMLSNPELLEEEQ